MRAHMRMVVAAVALAMSVADNVVAASLPRFSLAGVLRRGAIRREARAQVARLDARISYLAQKLGTSVGDLVAIGAHADPACAPEQRRGRRFVGQQRRILGEGCALQVDPLCLCTHGFAEPIGERARARLVGAVEQEAADGIGRLVERAFDFAAGGLHLVRFA